MTIEQLIKKMQEQGEKMAKTVFPCCKLFVRQAPDGDLVLNLTYAPPDKGIVKFDEVQRETTITVKNLWEYQKSIPYSRISLLCDEPYRLPYELSRFLVGCLYSAIERVL